VAANDATSPHLLARLARDWSHTVRAEVAASAATSTELLVRLARDRNHQVLLALIRNADTPDAALDEIDRRLHSLRGHMARLPGRGASKATDVSQALEQRRPQPVDR
jgi:hypothetical protein